jgi:hypothetical protein
VGATGLPILKFRKSSAKLELDPKSPMTKSRCHAPHAKAASSERSRHPLDRFVDVALVVLPATVMRA